MKYHWQFNYYDEIKATQLQKELKISPIIARLLVQRGIDTVPRANKFLYGTLSDLSDPFALNGMQQAVEHICAAIEQGEKIVIYGDYDVDGICSVCILMDYFKQIGCQVDYYIPERFTEGYGLNSEAIQKLSEKGYSLLVTVDCGIKSLEEIKKASSLGINVIVTDHHTPGEQLPQALAVVNPKIDNYEENYDLAGAGVAFKLIQALNKFRGDQLNEDNWLGLVALATIADVVPLLHDNRILVKHGLNKIQMSSKIGIKTLLAECGLDGKRLMPYNIAYNLAPRLNSAGRMLNAGISIELLMSEDYEQAKKLVEQLGELNSQRRLLEEEIFKEADLQIQQNSLASDWVLVVAGENWHDGVIGIVASRLSEKYNRPCILISWDGEIGKGSGRSIKGFDLYLALDSSKDFLLQFGGHKSAAGLSICRNDLDNFRRLINEWAKKNYKLEELIRRHFIDLEVEIEDINEELLRVLKLFEPCGEGNPKPILALRNTSINSAMLVGQGHFKGKIGTKSLTAIAFNRADLIKYPIDSCYHDQIFELTENEFRGNKQLQLNIKDMKPSYRPDRYSESSFSSALISIIEKCLKENAKHKPVIFICPTLRTLNRLGQILRCWFRPDLLVELHGKLAATKRSFNEHLLAAGQNKIFLVTLAYISNYLKRNMLPGQLKLIIQLWPNIIQEHLNLHIEDYDIETFGKAANIEWTHEKLSDYYPGKTLIYANRKNTIKHILNCIPSAKIEAGIQSINERRNIRELFWQTNNSILVTDGVYSGCNTYDQPFDQVLFADAPFCNCESSFILHQTRGNCIKAGILFGATGFELNQSYLNRTYPEIINVTSVVDALQHFHQNPIKMEINQLASKLESQIGVQFKGHDLLPILYVLSDLNLCQIYKKGSIIAIKHNLKENTRLSIKDSLYYQEGRFEKQALVNLINDYKSIITG